MSAHRTPFDALDAWSDATVSLEDANRIGATVVLPAVVVATAAAWLLLHGVPRLAWWRTAVEAPLSLLAGALGAAALLLLSILVHEALHALGIRLFARKPWRAIHYGIDRETVSPFVGCREPMTARAYRGWAALPGAVLGVLPLAWGLALGHGWIVLFGAYNLATAAGDLLVLWVIRHVPGDARVQDHPSRAGCRVLRPDVARRAAADAR